MPGLARHSATPKTSQMAAASPSAQTQPPPVGPWYRTPDAAAYCGVSSATLERHRWLKTGPAFSRTPGGRTIVYSAQALDAWMTQGAVQAA
jgi:hypothetical protein